ncbi:polysaccharide deacetylase family protein [Fulvivirga sp. 29W222]|uniref:Polysaccharide deacetylase family protein n=1 Tax=Fulvivirga marina TaxID=2494733 RepID=A0A937KFJ2_9BACT|nr:polysaccharide deacetylase family protein [Fulvivirga marina]MBL6448325.1 polysaccharide deacetylase family protein [Fulvivirga marina]
MFFHKTPAIVRWFYPQLTWNMPKGSQDTIYLTFDDGPIPGLTNFILDTLDQFEAKATFFCVGENLKKNKKIAENVINRGHTLANHTFNHLNGWKTSHEKYLENVKLCQNELENLGQQKKILRPPYGKISRKQIASLIKDYQIVMWDVLSGDYSPKINPTDCLEQTVRVTKNGAIVLFHDNLKAEANVKYALPAFVRHFHELGYQFKTLCMD